MPNDQARRSDTQNLGIERSLQRARAKGAGLIDEEFARSMIAVVKASGVANSMWDVTLKARVFEDEEAAIEVIRASQIAEDSCIIIRNGSTKGGPGMRETLGATSAVIGADLGETCALVTDGRFSGATHGPVIGYVMPEAARGGPKECGFSLRSGSGHTDNCNSFRPMEENYEQL